MKLEAENVGVRCGSRVAVAGVNLTAAPGELLAILGANGSGKSSLLRALAGVQAHAAGWRGEAGQRPPAAWAICRRTAARASR